MEAKSTDKKTFQLSDHEQWLGELHYETLFSNKAQIKLANADTYEIKPVGAFGTSISVTKDGEEVAKLKMNWYGQIVFKFYSGQEYVFKAKGVFVNKYIINNRDGESIIQLDPKFEWNKFNYSYKISYDKNPQDILFVMLSVYASNYFIAVMSGIVAATV